MITIYGIFYADFVAVLYRYEWLACNEDGNEAELFAFRNFFMELYKKAEL